MAVEFADLGQIRLAYETFGERQHPAVVLVMGLGAQMIVWPDHFCQRLAAGGYHVVRFDNRDIGQSSKLHGQQPSGVLFNLLRLRIGLPVRAPYTLYDMAKDLVGLMDCLDLPKAHLVGVSMGGMISQIVAANYYGRVRSLTSIMSSAGGPAILPQNPRVLLRMLKPGRDRDLESHIARKVDLIASLGGRLPSHREVIASRVGRALARSSDDEAGTRRQTAAILGTACRLQEIREVSVPTLVIHGQADPLIPLRYGIHTARSIHHAQIEVVPDMGHDLHPDLLEPLAGRILEHFDGARRPHDKKRRGAMRPFLY